MDQKKIGNFLRELRKSSGFTQEQVAEKLGVSSRTISRWETGAYMPDISMLVGIAEMYDVDVREIIDGERKEDNMNSEVKEVAEKMADYSTMEKNNMLKWFKMLSIGTMILSICMMIFNLVRPVMLSEVMHIYDGWSLFKMMLMYSINIDALLSYVLLAFSIVGLVFSSGRIKSISQNSKTAIITKIIIVAAIVLSVVAVVENIIVNITIANR